MITVRVAGEARWRLIIRRPRVRPFAAFEPSTCTPRLRYVLRSENHPTSTADSVVNYYVFPTALNGRSAPTVDIVVSPPALCAASNTFDRDRRSSMSTKGHVVCLKPLRRGPNSLRSVRMGRRFRYVGVKRHVHALQRKSDRPSTCHLPLLLLGQASGAATCTGTVGSRAP